MRRLLRSAGIAASLGSMQATPPPPKGRTKVATVTKTLKVGDRAPDFTLTSHLDAQITLSALRGQRVVLAFFSSAFTRT